MYFSNWFVLSVGVRFFPFCLHRNGSTNGLDENMRIITNKNCKIIHEDFVSATTFAYLRSYFIHKNVLFKEKDENAKRLGVQFYCFVMLWSSRRRKIVVTFFVVVVFVFIRLYTSDNKMLIKTEPKEQTKLMATTWAHIFIFIFISHFNN